MTSYCLNTVGHMAHDHASIATHAVAQSAAVPLGRRCEPEKPQSSVPPDAVQPTHPVVHGTPGYDRRGRPTVEI